MEQHNYGSARVSIFMAAVSTFSFLTKDNVAWAIGCASGIVAIVSGCMAIRHYYHATKKIKRK
jgi:uncharacterized membrane protein YfcA